MDEITVLILDHNGSKNTIACVDKLLSCEYEHMGIHILLNGSQLLHRQKIQDKYSENLNVSVYESDDNLGFAGGVNYLFQTIINRDLCAEFLLLLNNDVLVNGDALPKLKQVLSSDENIGIVFPKVLSGNGNNMIIAEDGLEFYPWLMQQRPVNYGKNPSHYGASGCSDSLIANATCVMIRKSLMSELRGFDEIYFAYFEDWDFCFRLRGLGKRIVYVADVSIWHEGSATTGVHSITYQFLMTRNRFLIARKYLSIPVFLFVFLPYFIAVKVIFKILQLFLKGHLQGMKGILLALMWLSSPVNKRQVYWPINGTCS